MTTHYSLILDEETLDKIRQIANKQYVKPSQIIRRILDQWVRLYGDTPWLDIKPPHYVDPAASLPQKPSNNLFDKLVPSETDLKSTDKSINSKDDQ